MTPQLQQAIKLLQLNNLELTELVNKELEENPFLENESNEEQVEKFDDETNDLSESFESGESIKDEKNEDYDNRWDTDLSFQSYSKSNDKDSIDPGSVVEQTLSQKVSLKGILKNQADLEFKSQKNKKISELLIDYIEPSGWLTSNLDELTNFSGYQKTEIENVLLRMQTFEPNGVFARNLKECLIIQLKNDERLTDNKRKNNQNWEVELNDSTLPKVTVNQGYINEIENLN